MFSSCTCKTIAFTVTGNLSSKQGMLGFLSHEEKVYRSKVSASIGGGGTQFFSGRYVQIYVQITFPNMGACEQVNCHESGAL